ncbi:MAG: hypothetical protein ACI9YO_002970, partial [Gammaproteobacteria bacterium]
MRLEAVSLDLRLLTHLMPNNVQQAIKANIEKIIDGSLQGSFAYLERQSRFELADVKTQAKRDGA